MVISYDEKRFAGKSQLPLYSFCCFGSTATQKKINIGSKHLITARSDDYRKQGGRFFAFLE